MEQLIQTGETVTLSNNKEYLVFSTLEDAGKNYIFLITTTHPIELFFAEQSMVNGQLDVRMIEDQAEKTKVLQLFSAAHAKSPAA